MEYAEFVVHETPHCVWVPDLDEENRRFLRSINPDYFQYVGSVHAANLKRSERKTDQLAAIALRATYSHGLESLFAIIGACAQAPHCTFAWLQRYRTDELRNLVTAIRSHQQVRTLLPIENVSFKNLARVIFQGLAHLSEFEPFVTKFATLWDRLATDFMDERIQSEYNSVKHGFRASSGGFQIHVGQQEKWGTPAPPESMQPLGGTRFGSTFGQAKPVGKTKDERRLNFALKSTSLAWISEALEQRLRLVAASIHNVLTYLKHSNGVGTADDMYMAPDDQLFASAFALAPSIDRFEVEFVTADDEIKPRSKEQTFEFYERWHQQRKESKIGEQRK